MENAKNRLVRAISNGKIRRKEADERIMEKKNRRYEKRHNQIRRKKTDERIMERKTEDMRQTQSDKEKESR